MRKKDRLGSITIIFITMLFIMIVTSFLSILGLEGQQTIITNNNSLETYLITTNNIFSKEGVKYFFNDAINNVLNFKPFIYFVLSLIGLSIASKSGLLNAFTNKLKRLKFKYLTMFVMIISMLSILIGDYSFAFLMPLVACIYKKIGKNPIVGLITVFMALTLGYGVGLFTNYSDYYLGTMSELSARVDVDKNYVFAIFSNIYIKVFLSIILIMITTYFVENRIAIKFSNPEVIEDDLNTSKEAMQYTFITFLFCLVVLALMIMPNVPYLGVLLDNNEVRYMAKLFGANSPFGNGLPYIILIIVMICSYVYGKVSKNITSLKDYSDGLCVSFENTGYIFVLMFFSSQLIGLIEWTNVGNVLVTILVDFMSGLQISGILLILISFILIVFMTLLVPSSVDKWVLISPIIIPLFMRSNITPNYTQFLFGVADGVGKSITPLFPYYILLVGLIGKYRSDKDLQLRDILKLVYPIALMIGGVLLLLLIGWFLIGLPLGIGTYISL